MFGMVSRAAIATAFVIALAACNGPNNSGGAPAPDPYLAGRAVQSWGANDSGQLGDGTNAQRLAPVPVHGLDSIRAIAAGGNRSLALLTDGTVWEWGAGHTAPTQVPGLANVTAIAAGGAHALARTSDHRVYAWGANDSGQLGDNSTTAHSVPVLVNNLTDALAIAAGRAHSVAIRADLSVVTWGANNKGQLGDGTTTNRLAPVTVPGLTAIEVATSADTTVAVTTSSTVVGWGANNECQLGLNPPTDHVVFTPRCDDSRTPLSLGGNVTSSGDAIAASATAASAGFSVANTTCPGSQVAANGGTCTISVTFSPLEAKPAVGELNVTYNSNKTASMTLRGIGIAPQGTIAPTSVTFTPTAVGDTSQAATLTITNTSSLPLTMGATAVTGDFQIVADNCDGTTLSNQGNTCAITVQFTPAASGTRIGQLTVPTNGLPATLNADLTGIGT